jgi:two-component system, LytTR family, response regulator LytT
MADAHGSGAPRLRTLIVEDEWPAREYLVELLLCTAQVDVVATVANADEARQALGPDGVQVDVVFVDINLASSGRDAGLEVVRQFVEKDGAPFFVMATALPEHAAEAFDLDVVDYLLKPFSEQRVRECVARIARRRSRERSSSPPRIVARNKRGLIFLRQSDAWAFEASERLTYVHCETGRFCVDLSLTAIETSLGPSWVRVHRNWVVNGEHVKALERGELGNEVVLGGAVGAESGNLRIPIARDKLQAVRDRLLEGTTGIRR